MPTRRALWSQEWSRGTALQFAGDFFQRHGFSAVAAGGDHDAVEPFLDEVGASGAQAGGEETVGGGRGAAPLHIAEDGYARFQSVSSSRCFASRQVLPVCLLSRASSSNLAARRSTLVRAFSFFCSAA